MTEQVPPLSVTELAAFTRKSERTIRRWIADYGIAPVRVDGIVKRYDPEPFSQAEIATRIAPLQRVLASCGQSMA